MKLHMPTSCPVAHHLLPLVVLQSAHRICKYEPKHLVFPKLSKVPCSSTVTLHMTKNKPKLEVIVNEADYNVTTASDLLILRLLQIK